MIAIMRNATPWPFNTLKPKQNDHHFAGNTFTIVTIRHMINKGVIRLLHFDLVIHLQVSCVTHPSCCFHPMMIPDYGGEILPFKLMLIP